MEVFWVFLQLVLGVGINFLPVFSDFGEVDGFFYAKPEDINNCRHMNEKQKARFCDDVRRQAEAIVKQCEENGWHILTPDSENYPEGFDTEENMPAVLYAQGDVSLCNRRIVGVAGTRNMSEQGKEDIENIIQTVYSRGDFVMSGGVNGCDGYALDCAMKAGPGLCLCAWGFGKEPNEMVKQRLQNLSREGLILTPYEPGRVSKLPFYQVRNRIMALLCDELIVAEASVKSGAFQVYKAFERRGKICYAVPGSSGCDDMLRRGAEVFHVKNGQKKITNNVKNNQKISANSAESLGKSQNVTKREIVLDNLSQNAIIVYNILFKNPSCCDTESLIMQSGLSATEAVGVLTELELMGYIRLSAPGKWEVS